MRQLPERPQRRRPTVSRWVCVAALLVLPLTARADDVRVLIAFKRAPGANERALVEKLGGRVHQSYAIVPAVAARLPAAALAALAKHPDVLVVEPDGLFQVADAELDAVWGVNRVRADLAQAASPTRRGLGVNVAVLDSGVDYNHPDLAFNYRGGYDFVNNDNDPLDDNGHGTHVSGTIAAVDNDQGVVGVAPQVNLYALKVLDSTGWGYFSGMIAALDWCVNSGVKIDIANHSYGSTTDPGSIVQQAYDNAYAAGILNVAAAGNNGTSAGTENNVIYPARYASVLGVGATSSSDVRATFSCTGPAVALAAPGQNIYSTLPGGRYGAYNGTSMACPHVAGAAAVLLEAARDTWGSSAVSNDYLWNILTSSAQDLGTTGADTWYGSGLVRIDYGLNAVALIQPTAPPPPPPPPSVNTLKATVNYTTSGPKQRDLTVTITIVDQNGVVVPGVAVNASITCSTTSSNYGGTKSTDSKGKATFKISSAPKGTWTTVLNSVTKSGYEWDGANQQSSYTRK